MFLGRPTVQQSRQPTQRRVVHVAWQRTATASCTTSCQPRTVAPYECSAQQHLLVDSCDGLSRHARSRCHGCTLHRRRGCHALSQRRSGKSMGPGQSWCGVSYQHGFRPQQSSKSRSPGELRDLDWKLVTSPCARYTMRQQHSSRDVGAVYFNVRRRGWPIRDPFAPRPFTSAERG